MRVFAVDGTYHPTAGDPLAVRVVLDRDVEPTQGGQQSTTVERRTELTGFHSELGDARVRELVTIGSETWRLDRKDRDDGYLVTWWVIPVTT
jgi:hypothetical protein